MMVLARAHMVLYVTASLSPQGRGWSFVISCSHAGIILQEYGQSWETKCTAKHREARGNKIKQIKLPQLFLFILEIFKAIGTVPLMLMACFNQLWSKFSIGLNWLIIRKAKFLPRSKSKPAEEEASLWFWRKTIKPQTCLQGMQLPATHLNLGTLESPAAGSCVIPAPEGRSWQAANSTLLQYLQQLHCKEGFASQLLSTSVLII